MCALTFVVGAGGPLRLEYICYLLNWSNYRVVENLFAKQLTTLPGLYWVTPETSRWLYPQSRVVQHSATHKIYRILPSNFKLNELKVRL